MFDLLVFFRRPLNDWNLSRNHFNLPIHTKCFPIAAAIEGPTLAAAQPQSCLVLGVLGSDDDK